jgi:hypothetical protein
MRFEKIWIEQCRATRAIKRRFGAKDALDYLVGEKLRTFAEAARHDVAFARELPRFLAAVWRVFNEYELIGYVARQKPAESPFANVTGRAVRGVTSKELLRLAREEGWARGARALRGARAGRVRRGKRRAG